MNDQNIAYHSLMLCGLPTTLDPDEASKELY
jgi:hypothetical protein